MLGVPLLTADRLLGVLHVGRLEHRPFTDHDVALLQVVADRVAGAIQSQKPRGRTRRRRRSWNAASSLNGCRATPGFELAARYVPAQGEAIGGDWYDVFTLPSGDSCGSSSATLLDTASKPRS